MSELREGSGVDQEFSDDELLRYSRHILLPQIDVAGQQTVCNSRVLIIGMGGLGSPVALYLAASGVGNLIVVDDDHVEISNLQRQIIHREATVNQPKVDSAVQVLNRLNHRAQITPINRRLSAEELRQQVEQVDVVADCSDNFATRTAVSQACVLAGKPLVSGAAIRLEGQLTVFDSRNPESPCYQCLYDLTGEQGLTCAESGVLSPMVGMIGSAQALEVMKLLAGFGEPLVGRLQLFDAAKFAWRELKLKKDPNCSVCGVG